MSSALHLINSPVNQQNQEIILDPLAIDDDDEISAWPRVASQRKSFFASTTVALLEDNSDDDDDDNASDEDESLQSSTHQPSSKWSNLKRQVRIWLGIAAETGHNMFYFLLWHTVFCVLAACIAFWIPSLSLWDLNIDSWITNTVGSFVLGIVVANQNIKFMYEQTYVAYDAINGGFVSAFTTYGNLIEHTDILLSTREWGFVKGLINFVAQVLLGVAAYQFGRLLALRWKAGAQFTFDLMIMENEDRRMEFELAKELKRKSLVAGETQPLSSRASQDSVIEQVEQSQQYGSMETSTSSSSALKGPPRSKRRSAAVDRSKLSFIATDDKLSSLETHMAIQLDKRRRHTWRGLNWRHLVVILAITAFFLLNVLAVVLVQCFWDQLPLEYAFSSVSPDQYNIFWYEFFMAISLSTLGALVGRMIGATGRHNRKDLNWQTFKVNCLSSFLIAIAHNALLLRGYAPGGSSAYFSTFCNRFIANFCGSESSFGGFIDDLCRYLNTKQTSKSNKHVLLKHIAFNLLFCTALFMLTVFAIRLILFYDVRFFL